MKTARASPSIQDGVRWEEREVCHTLCGPWGSGLLEGLGSVLVLSKVSAILNPRGLTTRLRNGNAFMKHFMNMHDRKCKFEGT